MISFREAWDGAQWKKARVRAKCMVREFDALETLLAGSELVAYIRYSAAWTMLGAAAMYMQRGLREYALRALRGIELLGDAGLRALAVHCIESLE